MLKSFKSVAKDSAEIKRYPVNTMISLSYKLLWVNIEQALSCVKILPHAYIHASPCMHYSHFLCCHDLSFPPSPAGEVQKRQNLQINHNASLTPSFDITPNEKKLNRRVFLQFYLLD